MAGEQNFSSHLPRVVWEDIVLSDIEEEGETTHVSTNETETTSIRAKTPETANSSTDIFKISKQNDQVGCEDHEIPAGDEKTSAGSEEPPAGIEETHSFVTLFLDPFFSKKSRWSSAQMIAVFMLNVMGILNSIGFVKNQIFLEDFTEHKLKYIVFLVYAINNLVYRLYFFGAIYCCNQGNVVEMLEKMKGWKNNSKRKYVTNMIFPVVCLLYITSLAVGVTWPILSAGSYWGWKIDQIALYRSYDFSITTLIWKNVNNTEDMVTLYGTNITGKTLCMAFGGTIFEISTNVQEGFIGDVSLVLALSMWHFSTDFVNFIKSPENAHDFDKIWEQYNKLRDYSKSLDLNFGLLLQLLHVENLLSCAYFLFRHVLEGSFDLVACVRALPLVKITLFYVISAKASNVNSIFCEWVRRKFPSGNTQFVENSEYVKSTILLHELENDPVGVGHSMFFIDRSFIWKFTSVVGSYSLFFARPDEN